jgi:hypothetical protein
MHIPLAWMYTSINSIDSGPHLSYRKGPSRHITLLSCGSSPERCIRKRLASRFSRGRGDAAQNIEVLRRYFVAIKRTDGDLHWRAASYTSGHRSGGATSIRNGIRSDCVSLRLMSHAAQDSKVVSRIDTYAMIERRTTQVPKSRRLGRPQGTPWGTRFVVNNEPRKPRCAAGFCYSPLLASRVELCPPTRTFYKKPVLRQKVKPLKPKELGSRESELALGVKPNEPPKPDPAGLSKAQLKMQKFVTE